MESLTWKYIFVWNGSYQVGLAWGLTRYLGSEMFKTLHLHCPKEIGYAELLCQYSGH
jgi:hypothetical protein